MLFGLGIVLVALGRPSDALVSVGVVLFNVIIGVIQEVRAKHTLDQIALLTRPRVNVIRAGQERAVDPSEIVMGDIVVARLGDQIVVDGQVIGNGHIDVDEALLTGESNLIHKAAGDPLYSASFCVTGAALYETQKVGTESFANQLTANARTFRRVLTPLQREINLVIRVILLIAAYFQVLLLRGSGWLSVLAEAKLAGDLLYGWDTYLVKAGQYGSVYSNMPAFGLGKAAELVTASGRRESARSRIGAEERTSEPDGVVTRNGY